VTPVWPPNSCEIGPEKTGGVGASALHSTSTHPIRVKSESDGGVNSTLAGFVSD
jgi:hypothetical protein